MKLIVNGKEKEFKGDKFVIQDVLDSMTFNTPFFVIFHNDEFVDRLQYLKKEVSAGDDLTIFPLVTGA